jgi:hypothetical protein
MVSLRRVEQYNTRGREVAQDALDDFAPSRGIVKDAQLEGDADQVDRVRIHDGPLGAIKGARRLGRTVVPNADGRIEGVFGLLILQPKGRHFGPREVLCGAHHGQAALLEQSVRLSACQRSSQ